MSAENFRRYVRAGRQTWLRAHIWLTILTLPLVFMHAAFRFGSLMTSGLMWLYLLVMLSGFLRPRAATILYPG